MTESIRASSLTLSPAALASYIANHAETLRESSAQLEAERDNFEAIGNRALAKIEEIEAERDELRQTVDRLDDALRLASREKDEWEANYEALATSTPRIITADELQEGQVVIEYFWDLSANYGRIVSLHADEGVGHATIRTEDGELEATAFGGPGGTIVLLADAPPQGSEPEPARRGRVVKPEELRKGDVCDRHYKQVSYIDQKVQRVCPDYVDFPTARIDIPDTLGGLELRLISRKPPVPSEHPVILVHRGVETYEEPVPAYLVGDAWVAPDRGKSFYADTLLDWTPLVPAGQEG